MRTFSCCFADARLVARVEGASLDAGMRNVHTAFYAYITSSFR